MNSFGKLSLEIMQLQLVLHMECNTETFLLTMHVLQEAVNDLRLILHPVRSSRQQLAIYGIFPTNALYF
jgi:hypothetical protein